jgi:hypothetical protein
VDPVIVLIIVVSAPTALSRTPLLTASVGFTADSTTLRVLPAPIVNTVEVVEAAPKYKVLVLTLIMKL